MQAAAFLIFVCILANGPEPDQVKGSNQEDTTTVAYWKKKAQVLALMAQNSAEEAKRQNMLADKSMREAAKRVAELNRIIEDQKRQLQDCKKR